MKSLLHRIVLGTRYWPGLLSLYRLLYTSAASRSAAAFLRVAGVRGVTLHRGLSREGWEPGVSDIDLILEREPLATASEDDFLRRLAAVHAGLKRAVPMLGDLWLGERRELEAYLRWGGLRAWEDAPDWRCLAGAPPPRNVYAASDAKRRRLDPWTWAFVSYVELSRRVLRPGGALKEKDGADAFKLYLDLVRYADAATGGVAPLSRAQQRAALSARPDSLSLWLDAARRLAAASRRVLPEFASAAVARPGAPRTGGGLAEEGDRLLKEVPAAVSVLFDPPYHTHLLLTGDAGEADLRAAALALSRPGLPGVPLALDPATWALSLQSAYLGAPLGLLGAESSPPQPGGLFDGWGASYAGAPLAEVPVLREEACRELAAEAATWMALWWRYLWLSPGWNSRFVLFHLYTRAMGLRLALDGAPPGPFSNAEGLAERCAARFTVDATFFESLRAYVREEPPRLLDLTAASELRGGHAAAIGELVGACVALADGEAACRPS